MPLHQFDYIFAIAMMFGFLDAFMIGMLPLLVASKLAFIPNVILTSFARCQ